MLQRRTSVAGRRERHRQLAAVLLGGTRPTDDDVLTATLSLRAAGDLPDSGRLLVAARSALARGEARLALELARAGAPDSPHGPQLRDVAAEAGVWLGLVPDADAPAVPEQAAPTGVGAAGDGAPPASGPPASKTTLQERMHAALGRAAALFLAEGRAWEAVGLLDDVLAAVPSTDPTYGSASALRCAALLARGRVDEARASLDGSDHRDGAVRAALVGALTWSGRPLDALDVARAETGAACGPVSDVEQVSLVTAQVLAGDLTAARDVARQAHLAAAAEGVPTRRAVWAQSRGAVELAAGHVHRAVPLLREAAAIMAEHPTGLGPAAQGHCLADLAEALLLVGDTAGAERALIDADALPIGECTIPALTLARARLAAAGGDRRAGVDLLTPAVADVITHGSMVLAVHGLLDLARLGQREPVLHGLAVLLPRLQGAALLARTEVARALVGDDPAALTDAADQADTAGLTGLAAEALEQAAHRYHQRGATADALRTAAAGRALARDGETTVPPMLRTPPLTAGLTPREQLVARHAAGGADNTTIATRLHLSRRTVETHLHRAYTKLGIKSRQQLKDHLDGADNNETPQQATTASSTARMTPSPSPYGAAGESGAKRA